MRIASLISALLIATLVAGGCDDTVSGARPIGGEQPTDAALQRFVRRSTLDLTGTPPTDAELTTRAGELRAAGNTLAARQAQVSALIASPAFAALSTEELENRVYGGVSLEDQYRFLCSVTAEDAGCTGCTFNDPCQCPCPVVQPFDTERAQLRTTATDFAAGVSSSELERRYASSRGYTALIGDPASATSRLFEDFLGRPAEYEEREAGRAMILGFGGPSGLLFHRLGASYTELVDITLASEVYREALVTRVFARYLGRPPRAAELAHFVGRLDADKPDVRPVITAVLTSKEYFDP